MTNRDRSQMLKLVLTMERLSSNMQALTESWGEILNGEYCETQKINGQLDDSLCQDFPFPDDFSDITLKFTKWLDAAGKKIHKDLI